MRRGFRALYRAPNLAEGPSRWSCHGYRGLSSSSQLQSGHSKWSTIKHDKAKNDSHKSKERAVHIKELTDASKLGGSDASFNPRLTTALANAKRAGVPKASIDAAIARGQGRSLSGDALENVTVEAVRPPVAMIVECQTDSKARLLKDIRYILKYHGATSTPAAYLFDKRGRITFQQQNGVDMNDVLEVALEHSAIDVREDEEGRVVVDTELNMLKPAERAISEALKMEIHSSETIWHPNEDTKVSEIDPESYEELGSMVNELEEYAGVEAVYTNFEPRKA